MLLFTAVLLASARVFADDLGAAEDSPVTRPAPSSPAVGDAPATTPPSDNAPQGLNRQQLRMRDCNRRAKEKALKGDPRKDFMRNCLRGGQVSVWVDGVEYRGKAEPTPEQLRVRGVYRDCAIAARELALSGDARKAFMRDCAAKAGVGGKGGNQPSTLK